MATIDGAVIKLPPSPTGNPHMDCIDISDFLEHPLDVQLEYAIHYQLPNANQMSLADIKALLSGNQWIPALKHHVWIPRPDLKGVTVSRDLDDLETWCANAVVAQALGTQKFPSLLPPAVLYSLLLEQFEEAHACIHSRLDLSKGSQRHQNEVGNVDVGSRKGRYIALASLSRPQLALSKVRIQLIRNLGKHRNFRKRTIVLQGDILGEIAREIDNRSMSSSRIKDQMLLKEVDSSKTSKLSRGRVAELRLAAKNSAGSVASGALTRMGAIKAKKPRSFTAQSGSATRSQQQTNNYGSNSLPSSSEASATTNPGATSSAKATLCRSDGIERDKKSPVKSDRRRKSGRRGRRGRKNTEEGSETPMLEVIHEESADDDEAENSQSMPDPEPQASVEDDFEIITPSEHQHFEIDGFSELEGQASAIGVSAAEQKPGTVSGFITGFKSICADASQAVVGSTHNVVSGVQTLLAIGGPKRKRNRTDEGSRGTEEVDDHTPTTPIRKRVRLGSLYTQDTPPGKTTPSPSARYGSASVTTKNNARETSSVTRRRRSASTRVTIGEFGQLQSFPTMEDRMDLDPPARAYTKKDETQLENLSTQALPEAGPSTPSAGRPPRTRAMALSSSRKPARKTGVKPPVGRN